MSTMARSIPGASRALTGLTSTLSDGATAWIAPNWAGLEELAESRRTATRVTSGAICLSSSSHFALMLYSATMKPGGVAARPRQAVNEASGDRIGDDREHDRHGAGRLQQRPHGRGAMGQDDVGYERGQFRRVSANFGGIGRGPAGVDAYDAADAPAQLLQPLQERPDAGLEFHIVRGCGQEYADAPHTLALLPTRH